MALTLSPLPSSSKLDSSFGRVASLSSESSDRNSGEDLISDELFGEIEKALYTHGVIVFPKVRMCSDRGARGAVRVRADSDRVATLTCLLLTDSTHTCRPIRPDKTLRPVIHILRAREQPASLFDSSP